MNRLAAPPITPAISSKKSAAALDLLDGRFPDNFLSTDILAAGVEAPVATFAPIHYEAAYRYPLVVWLHDAGQTEHDLAAIMPCVSTRNYVAIAPAAEAMGAEAVEPWRESLDAVAETERLVFDAIETASDQFNVHPERIFLAGSGRGGTAALRVALANPASFAGAASLDGPMPRGGQPLRRVGAVRGLPLMLSAGSDSARYPEARLCDDLRLLHSAGCQLSIRQEPGDGDLTTTTLAELDRWMMAIVCGEATAAS